MAITDTTTSDTLTVWSDDTWTTTPTFVYDTTIGTVTTEPPPDTHAMLKRIHELEEHMVVLLDAMDTLEDRLDRVEQNQSKEEE